MLPEEAVVIIGGEVGSSKKLARDARQCRDRLAQRGEEPVHGVSVCSLPDRTAEEIAQAATTHRLPQSSMRVSTVARLRDRGYDVVPSGDSPHATLTFEDAPTDADWNNLQHAFSAPRDNPVARRERNAT